MGEKCNCYRFSPRDSLSGAVAQIADYLSKHPGWNETELRTFVDGLISSAGVETFNGRSGNVTLNKDDVNNLLIANCYFAEADETIENIDVLALYKLGIRIVFTQYSSELDGYTLAYGIEYYPGTDTAKAYLFSSGSGGVGAVVSVNGKTGTVVLKAGDILMNNGDSVEYAVYNAKAIANAAYSPDNPPPYPVTRVNGKTGSVTLKVIDVSNGDSVDDNAYIFIDEAENYPDIIAPDSNKLGGQIPSYYATADSVNSLKSEMVNYRTAVNLLDNSWWKNPKEIVNQRGETSKQADWVYWIDRWLVNTTSAAAELRDGGIYLPATTSGNLRMVQRIPIERITTGQAYTLAVCESDGAIRCVSGVYNNDVISGDVTGDMGMYITLQPGGETYVYFIIDCYKNFTIRWAALYEGAYTAETLPPYVPKGYAAELVECRRFFQPKCTVLGRAINQDYIAISYNFSPPMRIKPSCMAESVQLNGINDSIYSGDMPCEGNNSYVYQCSGGGDIYTAGGFYQIVFNANADL